MTKLSQNKNIKRNDSNVKKGEEVVITQFLKRNFTSRILITVILAQFIFGANTAKAFARTDSLRSQATVASQLINDLKDTLTPGTKASDITKFDGIEGTFTEDDYRLSQPVDNLPFGNYITKTINLSAVSAPKLADIFKTPVLSGEQYSVIYYMNEPIALEKKDSKGNVVVKKIVTEVAKLSLADLVDVDNVAEFQQQGKGAIDLILSDYLFLKERANIAVPERMTIEFKELNDYLAEVTKEKGAEEADKIGLALTGGKGKSLSLMAGVVDVPKGFNVSTTAYFKFVVDNKPVWEKLHSELRNLDTMDDQKRDAVTREIRELIKNYPIPAVVAKEVLVMYRQILGAVAVRSSGIKEDIKIESWMPITTGSQAGQSDTFLNVEGEKAVLDKLRMDWASLFTDRAVSYRDDAIFLIFSSVIRFENKQPSQVYSDLKDKIAEYARKQDKPEFKAIADTLGELHNPGSLNLKNALEALLASGEDREIKFCLDKLLGVSEEFVHPQQIGIDVVIMRMVKSYVSGVLFTVNPATKMAGVAQALWHAWHGDGSLVYKNEKGEITGAKPIVSSSEEALGYGENVVGGKVDPDKVVKGTYDGKHWFTLERHKGTKLIQMINVKESITLLKGKLDEAKIRSLASMVAEAISHDEVGKRINGILVTDLKGTKYLKASPDMPAESDKDKKARVQKIAEEIANKIKEKESKAAVREFIAKNFVMAAAGQKSGIQESELNNLIEKVFNLVEKSRAESDKGMKSLTQFFGKETAADDFILMIKEVWENKEFDLQERYAVLKTLNLDSSEMKDLSYLIRALVDNSFTANLGTKVQHQNAFCMTEEMEVALARMGWDISTYYKDQRDVEFAFEIDPNAPEDKRLECYPLDLLGNYLAINDKGELVKVADKKDLVKFKKVSLRLSNVQARPYTATYAKVDLVRQRTEVDEDFINEKGLKPIASGTKGENATHAYVLVFDTNKTIDWHAETIRRLKRGEFIEAEKGQIKKLGFNLDDYGPGKDAKLPIALYLLEADPNHDPIMRLVDAVLTIRGGDTCHAAIFCREQGIPAITALGRVMLDGALLSTGMGLTVDANNGNLYKLEADPAKRIPINFVKFRIKPYGIPGDDDGMVYPMIGQVIASPQVAQQNSPIMLAVDADGNSLTRAEFKAEEMGLNVFAGYGYDLIQGIKSGDIKRPVYIPEQDVIDGKVAGARNFVDRLNSQYAKDFKHNEAMKLLVALENKQDLSNLTQEQRDVLDYLYGVFQRRFNFDYNIIAQLESHPWVLQEIENKLKEKGYASFKAYAGEEFYEFYNLMGFTIAPNQKAKNRAYDFAQDKIRGMPGSEIFSWPGVNPLVGLRGSALEIEGLDEEFEGNQKVLDLLLEAVTRANENTHNQAWFYVFVRFTRELDSLDLALEKIALKQGKLPKQVGIMIEVPSDALLADKLAKKMSELQAKYKKYGSELVFFSFGTNDYSYLSGKGDREDPRMKLEIKDPAAIAAIPKMKQAGYYYDDAANKLPLVDEGADVMISLIEAVVKEANAVGVDTSLCGEAITNLVGRGDYDSAGKIMALLKSFGVSMMNRRLAASMTRYDTMAATKEITVPADQRRVLVDLGNDRVSQKAGVIKGEIIYIDKAEDLVPDALKDSNGVPLKGAALEERKDFLKMQSAESAQSTMRTYNKIVVLSKNLAALSEKELTDIMGAETFVSMEERGLLKSIGTDLYVWTNMGTSSKKFLEELEKEHYGTEVSRNILDAWQKARDNTTEGLEARGIDWDDLQYAKAIILDDSVNLEGWDVFLKTKGIVPTRVKATVKGIGAMRGQLENQFVTIDYGAKKIYAGNLAVKKKNIVLRGLPIPASEPVVPVKAAVQEDANSVYVDMAYHPLAIIAYQEGKLKELEKIFDDCVGKLMEELGKIDQEQNSLKKAWLLGEFRKKTSKISEPAIRKFIEEFSDKVSSGEKLSLPNNWDRDLKEKYFRELDLDIGGLLNGMSARDFIKESFKLQMEKSIAANKGKFLVHTTTSLNCAEFDRLRGGFLIEQINPSPDYGLLGAARAIGDFHEINRLELQAFKEVRAALPKEERKDFGLQITELKGTQAGAIMIAWADILKDLNIIPGEDGLEVGVNIATPTDTLAVDRYFEFFKGLGTGLNFVTIDNFKLGAAWAGVDIYWNEWRRLAREEELLEVGGIAAKIVKGKIEGANKADEQANKKLVVFGSGEVVVNAASIPVTPTPVVTSSVAPVQYGVGNVLITPKQRATGVSDIHYTLGFDDVNVPSLVPAIYPNKIPAGGRLTVGGNWKLRPFKDEAEARAKAKEFKAKFADIDPNAEIVLFVEDKWMKPISEELQGSNIRVGAESFYFDPAGNIKEQIEDAVSKGAKYAMIGHSMHRNPDPKVLPGVLPLTNANANTIVKEILNDGRLKLWYVIAINEDQDPDKTAFMREYDIKKQIDEGINTGLVRITEEQLASIIITVEPTADISTKAGDGAIDPKTKVNFPKVELLARLLDEVLRSRFGKAAVEKVNTGYGASASPDTAATLLSHPNVFNILPGGKSLEANDFYGTVVNAIIGKYGSNQADVELAKKIGVSLQELEKYIASEELVSKTQGAKAFGEFISAVRRDVFSSSLDEPADVKAVESKAIIIAPEFFKLGGARDTLKQLAALDSVIKIGLYGDNAEKMKLLLGDSDNIITGKTLEEVQRHLSQEGVPFINMLLLKSPYDTIIGEAFTTLNERGIKQIFARDMAPVAVAKAIAELLNKTVATTAFDRYYQQLFRENVISGQVYHDTKNDMAKKLEGLTLNMPEAIKPVIAEDVSQKVESAKQEIINFVSKV